MDEGECCLAAEPLPPLPSPMSRRGKGSRFRAGPEIWNPRASCRIQGKKGEMQPAPLMAGAPSFTVRTGATSPPARYGEAIESDGKGLESQKSRALELCHYLWSWLPWASAFLTCKTGTGRLRSIS